MKIQNKIIYMLVAIFVLYTVLFSIFIYYSVSNYVYADFYKRLEIRAAITAKVKFETPGNANSIKQMGQEYLEVLPNQIEYIIPVTNNAIIPDSLSATLPQSLLNDILENTSGNYRIRNMFYSGIRYKAHSGKEYLVVISAENYFYSHHIAYIRNLLIGTVIFGVLWIVFFSFIISRTLVQPVKNIVRKVEKIGSENLHLRLDLPKKNDSLKVLASTFNDMLNRLETSFETQKNFISNASHELNTPLTTIIGEADFALSKERDSESYRAALEKILEEAENLEKKTKALLFLAQTGYNGKAQKFEKIRIDQLILDVKKTVQEINSGLRLSIDFSLLPDNPEKLTIRGNEQLLHLALSNIIVNACKYSDNQLVFIALGASDTHVYIIVRDSGIGIPESEMPYIYDPYFRASNTSNYKGYGIGLPLSRNIVRMHKGTLTVSSRENSGTTVQINLPIGKTKI